MLGPLNSKALWSIGLAAMVSGVGLATGLEISNRYSPRNRERSFRKQTQYILLHTTEGPTKGSLNKVHRYGEAHYLVAPNGHVYRVVNKRRIALHAGRSMWKGRTNLDSCAVGIEVVGYHNKAITGAQYKALRELLEELQHIFGIPDERVLTHSMVAYGTPNRWHKRSHRGRKRCGMLFAKRNVRTRLGLTRQPLFDPDVRAGRLVNADPYLAKVLYGSAREQVAASVHFEGQGTTLISAARSAWDIARDKYRSADTTYVFPDGRKVTGNAISNWKAIPVGTRVILSERQSDNAPEGVRLIGRDGSAAEIAGDEARARTTIYFLKDGRVRQGNELSAETVETLSDETRMLVGYQHGGYITSRRSAFDICGEKWDHPSTFYRFTDSRIVSGMHVTQNAIPPRTMVFFQR